MPRDRPKLAESIRVCPRITAAITLAIAAHDKAFVCVLDHVTTHVTNQKGIGRRSSLYLVYIE